MDQTGLEPLALTTQLFHDLEAAGLRYCHWKSTTTLPRALAGRTDLDLLVDPAHAEAFRGAARDLGFRPFTSHPSRRYPGVEDLLGLDDESGRLVHLHVYLQLVLGEEYVKNHLLPMSDALLSNTITLHGVRAPVPELEIIVLALRTLLKYRDTDLFKDRLNLGERTGIPPSTLAELRDLASRVDRGRVRELVNRHLPGVDPGIVLGVLDVAALDGRHPADLARLRQRARIALRPYQRMPRVTALSRYARARIGRVFPLKLITHLPSRRQARRKSPASGGHTVALVGVDGSGKSTIVSSLFEWLAWRVNVRVLYLGSARPSPSTRVLRSLARALRTVGRRVGSQRVLRMADLAYGVRYLGDARDRARRAAAGKAAARRGAIVLHDRFPLPVDFGTRTLDGPRIHELPTYAGSRLLRWMAHRERSRYRSMPMPDLVVVVDVRPATALERKPNADPAALAAKATALAAALTEQDGVVHIQGDRPLEEVMRDVKRLIWALL
jgi:thymidylate kinase